MSSSALPLSSARSRGASSTAVVPWPILGVLFSSTAVVIGIIWDISWHRTIGRDTFWTPAHMSEYLGGVVAGLSCGWIIIKTSFFGGDADRAAGVRFWHYFTGPTGAWVAVWGTFAMLTSAPFDDWWHNAYGLDVKILSPPHMILGVGITAIAFGAMLMTLALQNRRADEADAGPIKYLYAYSAGLVVLFVGIFATEYMVIPVMHHSMFYKAGAIIFPFLLIATARGSSLRWPATTVAAMYMIVTEAMVLILPLFPAEAKLGPIRHVVTHMVPPDFPFLLVVPAAVLDLVMRRFPSDGRRDWLASVTAGLAFISVFFVTQWVFGQFLHSPLSRNAFFAANEFDYGTGPQSFSQRYAFFEDTRLAMGLAIAALYAVISARAGLWCGSWMRRVRR